MVDRGPKTSGGAQLRTTRKVDSMDAHSVCRTCLIVDCNQRDGALNREFR